MSNVVSNLLTENRPTVNSTDTTVKQQCGNRRSKPFGSLGSRTIGSIYGDNGHGNAGIEKQFDKYLCGKDGESRLDRVAGRKQHIPIREAESGADIYTTLDANLNLHLARNFTITA